MPRSYFYLEKRNYSLFSKAELYEADALIIDLYDAVHIFNNMIDFYKYFEKMKEQGISIYLHLDTRDLKKCYEALNQVDGKYLAGFVIPHASLKLLNKLMIKVREFEQNKKLDFGSLHFIAMIDTPEGIVNYRKIALYERVKCLGIDEQSYRSYLGFDEDESSAILREQIALYSAVSKKPLIDSATSDHLHEELMKGKKMGATAKATRELKQIKVINDFYLPKEEEIDEALMILDTYVKTPKKQRRFLIVDNIEISPLKIYRSQMLINRANRLKLIEENPKINLVIKDEELAEVKPQKPHKKFYTLGEEIANAITHGVGIIFSLCFLILLIFKASKNNNNIEMTAYIVYCFSAFMLYFASTLYHGLPLGSSSKRLFRKFDHMTIYLLIAGTYTPFTLLAVGGNLGIGLFIGLWVGAALGFILNLFWFGKFKYFHMILYLSLGWIAIFFINTVILSIGFTGSIYLIAGGLAYTLGIIFYALKLFKFTHMVWHLFVLLGTILHFITIYFYL